MQVKEAFREEKKKSWHASMEESQWVQSQTSESKARIQSTHEGETKAQKIRREKGTDKSNNETFRLLTCFIVILPVGECSWEGRVYRSWWPTERNRELRAPEREFTESGRSQKAGSYPLPLSAGVKGDEDERDRQPIMLEVTDTTGWRHLDSRVNIS